MKKHPPLALCYHGVADIPLLRDRSRLFVRPKDLERQIRTLLRWNYRIVPFSELARHARDGDASGLASLTFDDGLVDNVLNLVPILISGGVPATLFVVSDWLGKRHPDAPWTRVVTGEELRGLSRAGLEIGAHSTRHDHLPDLRKEAARTDMSKCREMLEGVIERPVSVFAYPYGGATVDTMAACEAAGYEAACRCGGAGSWQEAFNLPRQDVQNRDSSFSFWLKRDNRYERLVDTNAGLALRRSYRLARKLGA